MLYDVVQSNKFNESEYVDVDKEQERVEDAKKSVAVQTSTFNASITELLLFQRHNRDKET